MDSDDIILINVDLITSKIKDWVLKIKENYQIYDYDYSVDIKVGMIHNKKIMLKIDSIAPKPILVYKIIIEDMKESIYRNNNKLLNYLKKITENTRVI